MQAMLRQAQKMQADIEQKKAELDEKEYVVSSGGGMVEVTMTGSHQVKSIGINPEVVDPEDVEMLEDMLVAALNETKKQKESWTELQADSISPDCKPRIKFRFSTYNNIEVNYGI